MVIWEYRHQCISNLRGEATFYWVYLEGGWWNIYVQNYAGCWLEVHFMVHALPRGLVVLIKLFYWWGPTCAILLIIEFHLLFLDHRRHGPT